MWNSLGTSIKKYNRQQKINVGDRGVIKARVQVSRGERTQNKDGSGGDRGGHAGTDATGPRRGAHGGARNGSQNGNPGACHQR